MFMLAGVRRVKMCLRASLAVELFETYRQARSVRQVVLRLS